MPASKAELRLRLRDIKPTARQRAQEGERAARRVAEWPVYQQSQCVACYSALPWELDTLPVLQRILADGKTLLLPKVTGGHTMVFLPVADLAAMKPGPFGILEPTDGTPQKPELVLMPAEAVDKMGNRLGKGGGYYDRYLEKEKGSVTAALVLTSQILACVPAEAHDQPVAYVVTADELWKTDCEE